MNKIYLSIVLFLCFNVFVRANVATNYSFSQSSTTYSSISATGTQLSAATWDNNIYTVTIPWNFSFDGNIQTTLKVSTNGFVTFGSTSPGGTIYNPIAGTGTFSGALAAMGCDLANSASSSGVYWQVSGSSPNRILTVEWKNGLRYTYTDLLNFQIKLYETSNMLQVVYGSCTPASGSTTAVCGLRGTANTDYNNRAATTSWSSTTAGGANTAAITISGTIFPVSGLTYTWCPTIGSGFNLSSSVSGTPGCSPATVTATGIASGASYTYVWAGATGLSSVNTATTTATVSAATVYTVTMTNRYGCQSISTASVTPSPNPITGPSSVCGTATISLSTTTIGGLWSTSNSSIATVNSAGVVTGLSAGTVAVSYTALGCNTSTSVTVNAPSPITGNNSVCIGAQTNLSDTTIGGTWSSSNTAVATIDAYGMVTGGTAGATNIIYTQAGCGTVMPFNVYSTPTTITGPSSVCGPTSITIFTQDFETPIGTAVPVGTTVVNGWKQLTNPATNYMTTGTGVGSGPTISGPQSGNYYLKYSLSGTNSQTLCSPSFSLVNCTNVIVSFWVWRDITATYNTSSYGNEGFSAYINTSSSLTGATLLGFVPRAAGIAVTGVSGASTTITSGWYKYTVSLPVTFTGETNYVMFSMVAQNGYNSYLDNISLTGTLSSTITLADASEGGNWSSSDVTKATINASGTVTGVSQGTTTISYTNICGHTTQSVTVYNTPSTITGTLAIPAGCTTALLNSALGGTWSSSNTSVASINSVTGVVSAIGIGTTTITYSTGCGAAATVDFTVTTFPPITGPTTVCIGGIITLFNSFTGGTWSSNDVSIATVNSSGVVTGINLGVTTITYMSSCGNYVTSSILVAGEPSAIGGTFNLCHYTPSTVSLFPNQDFETPAGGAVPNNTTAINGWALLTNPSTAYFSSAIGTGTSPSISGAQSGSYYLKYSFAASNSVPQVLASPAFNMIGISAATLTLWVYRDATSSYNTSGFSAEGFTLLINTSAGTTGATTLGFIPRAAGIPVTGAYINGVSTTTTANWYQYTVSIPASYTGSTNYIMISCISANGSNAYLDNIQFSGTVNNITTTTLTNIISGGVWASSATSIGTIGSSSGLLTAVNQGTTNVTYTNCSNSVNQTVVIKDNPGPITGTTTMYVGCSNTLFNSAISGVWSSSNSAIATVNPNMGVVTGISIGSATITYSNSCGVNATTDVTVNSFPAITGNSNICLATTTTLYNAVVGGTWSSGNSSIAAINTTTGVVSGISAGSALITYTTLCGAYDTFVVNIIGPTAPISGTFTLCAPQFITLLSQDWESPAGVAVPVSTTPVSGWFQLSTPATNYMITASGIGTLPTISGPQSGNYYLKYSWTAPTGTTQVVSSPTVNLTGISGAVLTFWVYRDITSPYNIATFANEGFTILMNTSASTSGATTLGFVPRAAGKPVVGSISGTSTTTIANWYEYTCSIPATFNGANNYIMFSSISQGGDNAYLDNISLKGYQISSTTLSDSTIGGTWSTNNAGIASINNSTGLLSGVSSGTTIITYNSSCGTPVTQSITITPPFGTFTGNTTVCVGSATTLTNSAGAGIWSSSNSSIASVNTSTGVVTGIAAGSVTISFSNACGHIATIIVIVKPNPLAVVSLVTSPCIGHAGSIYFTGVDSATVDYKIDGGSVNSFTFVGTTYILSAGLISTPHTYVIKNAHNPLCTTIINDTFTINPIPMTWVGGTAGHESNWNTATNWTCGFAPTVSDDAVISAATYAPSIAVSDSGFARNLALNAGSALLVNNNAVLNVKGTLTNNSNVSGSGKLILNNTTAQLVKGIGTVSNLVLSNAAGATIDTGSRLMIGNTLYVTSGTLTTNDSLELVSDYYFGGRIAPMPTTGAHITGKVTVDQYVEGGYRRYRFWSHPFSTSISLSQMQQYIDITGFGGAANGFTFTTTNAPSAFRYSPYTANDTLSYDTGWKAFTKINAGAADSNLFHAHQGVRLFFRGVKGEGLLPSWATYTPSAFTAKMSGFANQGPQTVVLEQGSVSPAHQSYNMVGNPYASPVDIGSVLFAAKNANQVTGSAFYVWSPRLSGGGNYVAILMDGTPYYLPIFGAFQVQAHHDGAVLNFVESNKGALPNNYLFKSSPIYCELSIRDENNEIWDMLRIRFTDDATDNEDHDLDAVKLLSTDFKFYSFGADGRKLTIDARPYGADKVIPLGIGSAYKQDFIIRADNIAVPAGGNLYLHDKLLNKTVEMKAGSEYKFTITDDKSTQGDNRFELALKPTVATVKPLSVTMTPNPTTDDVKISFTSGSNEEVSVSVMDMSGVSIYNTKLGVKQSGVVRVPLGSFASGVYMVDLKQGNQVVRLKLIKE